MKFLFVCFCLFFVCIVLCFMCSRRFENDALMAAHDNFSFLWLVLAAMTIVMWTKPVVWYYTVYTPYTQIYVFCCLPIVLLFVATPPPHDTYEHPKWRDFLFHFFLGSLFDDFFPLISTSRDEFNIQLIVVCSMRIFHIFFCVCIEHFAHLNFIGESRKKMNETKEKNHSK